MGTGILTNKGSLKELFKPAQKMTSVVKMRTKKTKGCFLKPEAPILHYHDTPMAEALMKIQCP